MNVKAGRKERKGRGPKIPDEIVKQLGKRSDRELEAETGISVYYLRRSREALGIAAFAKPVYSAEIVALLGTVTDAEISKCFNVTKSSVFRLRERLRIPRLQKIEVPARPEGQAGVLHPIPAEAINLLGTIPDEEIAAKYGIPVFRITHRRTYLKINKFKISLPAEAIPLLGQIKDKEIASRFNVKESLVFRERVKRFGSNAGRNWEPAHIALLGTMSDADLSAQMNVDKKIVSRVRYGRGIAPFSRRRNDVV